MIPHDEEFEKRIASLLAASRAHANPATLARARERLAEREAIPAVARWLGRPVGLIAASALLVVSALASITWVNVTSTAAGATPVTETSLVSSLLDDDGTYGVPGSLDASAASRGARETSTRGGSSDSGQVTP